LGEPLSFVIVVLLVLPARLYVPATAMAPPLKTTPPWPVTFVPGRSKCVPPPNSRTAGSEGGCTPTMKVLPLTLLPPPSSTSRPVCTSTKLLAVVLLKRTPTLSCRDRWICGTYLHC